ncbi:MAG: type II toxin-antitoxin system VapC family toxin [Nitrososphaerales archaeon]
MTSNFKRILTLDANVFVGAARADEPHRKKCIDIIKLIPASFLLSEPSIVYQEVCGTIARRVGTTEAEDLARKMDKFVPSELLVTCDRNVCFSSYALCSEYGIYSVDALYLSTAIMNGAILVSLDDEDFIKRLRGNRHNVEVYHVKEFPYS